MTVGRHSLKPRCLGPGSRHCFLWACYFKENLSDLTLAARYDAFLDQPPGQRRHVARRTDSYPPEGLSRLSDAAAIAALVGGRLLPSPFDELLTRIEPERAKNVLYTRWKGAVAPAPMHGQLTVTLKFSG